MSERERLLCRITQVGFVLDELILYLDTHPDCCQAIMMYNEQAALYEELQTVYNCRFGPLTADSAQSCGCWTWVEDPWPWELEG